jgi:hypothetical protein
MKAVSTYIEEISGAEIKGLIVMHITFEDGRYIGLDIPIPKEFREDRTEVSDATVYWHNPVSK